MSLKKNKQTLKKKQQKASGLKLSLSKSLDIKRLINSTRDFKFIWDNTKNMIKAPEIHKARVLVESSQNKPELVNNLINLVKKSSNSPQKQNQLIASIRAEYLPKNPFGQAYALKKYITSDLTLKKIWDESSKIMSIKNKKSPKILELRKAAESSKNKQDAEHYMEKLKELIKNKL